MFFQIFLHFVSNLPATAVGCLSVLMQRIPVLKKYTENTHQKKAIFSKRQNLPCIAPLLATVQETLWTSARVQGHLPKWLNGSLLRIGPGKFEFGKDKYNHWFDRMALLHQFRMEKGTVTYRSKFLQSDTYKANSVHDRIVISEFGTLALPDPCKNVFERFMSKFEPPAMTDNTNVNYVRYKGDYYISTETNFMNKVDIETLEKTEKVNWSKFITVSGATAHPHYDPDGTTFNMGNSYGPHAQTQEASPPALPFLEDAKAAEVGGFFRVDDDFVFPEDKPSAGFLRRMATPGHGQVGTCIASVETGGGTGTPMGSLQYDGSCYNVIRVPPERLDSGETIHGAQVICSIASAEGMKPSYYHSFGEIRPGDGLLPRMYYSKPFVTFHQINAFEDQGCVIIDLCGQDNGKSLEVYQLQNLRKAGEGLDQVYDSPAKSFPLRFVWPLQVSVNAPEGENLSPLSCSSARAVRQADGKIWCSCENLHPEGLEEEGGIEFSQINYSQFSGKKYNFFYGCGFRHLVGDSLIKVDVVNKKLTVWREDGFYPSEPVFVPVPGANEEDGGIILSTVITPNQNESNFLLVLDAKNFEELGRAEVLVKMPYGFHGTFVTI